MNGCHELSLGAMAQLRKLPGQLEASHLVGPNGEPVLRVATLAVRAGDLVRVHFERAASDCREGVWLSTKGVLAVDAAHASQFNVWSDTAPPLVEVAIVETTGLLQFCNIRDSGRGRQSQLTAMGMVAEPLNGGTRYRCQDGRDPADWNSLVFTIALRS